MTDTDFRIDKKSVLKKFEEWILHFQDDEEVGYDPGHAKEIEYSKTDSDFDNIRESPEFQELTNSVEQVLVAPTRMNIDFYSGTVFLTLIG